MTAAGPDTARRLFSYLGGEEWSQYREILDVFAGTFFAEFTPEDVTERLTEKGMNLPVDTVAARLESLATWGNVTVSSSVGNPTSLDDYYRRRNRYLITRAGQEVHGVVEDIITRVDEVRDVTTGRLETVKAALEKLVDLDLDEVDAESLAEAVREVFDPHMAFTNEITQFFAAINQWQSRYDLDPEELGFFTNVLVGYVSDRIHEIERTSRPIGRLLNRLGDRTDAIATRVGSKLAERVERAGLSDTVVVSHAVGSRTEDWDHLAAWFVSRPSQPSRIDQLTRQAVAAVRTLTTNLSRLSRVGLGASSRRADFLRLAGFFNSAADDQIHTLASAAFGLHGPVHLEVLTDDHSDSVPTTTSWWDAPKALVPVSLRKRGDTRNRGRASPVRDRTKERALIHERRQRLREARRRVDQELIGVGDIHGSHLSMAALARLQGLLDRSSAYRVADGQRTVRDGAVVCTVRPIPGTSTVVTCPEGTLVLENLTIDIATTEPADVAG